MSFVFFFCFVFKALRNMTINLIICDLRSILLWYYGISGIIGLQARNYTALFMGSYKARITFKNNCLACFWAFLIGIMSYFKNICCITGAYSMLEYHRSMPCLNHRKLSWPQCNCNVARGNIRLLKCITMITGRYAGASHWCTAVAAGERRDDIPPIWIYGTARIYGRPVV